MSEEEEQLRDAEFELIQSMFSPEELSVDYASIGTSTVRFTIKLNQQGKREEEKEITKKDRSIDRIDERLSGYDESKWSAELEFGLPEGYPVTKMPEISSKASRTYTYDRS